MSLRFILVTALFLSMCACVAADSAETPQPGESTPRVKQDRHLFGCGVIWSVWFGKEDREWDRRSLKTLHDMGATSVGVSIPWNTVEPKEGQWAWDYVDHQVDEALRNGLEPFAYMGLTPDWALPDYAPKNQHGIGWRYPPPDDREAQFIAYCSAVAKRYKGKVRYYQFWNEPNGCSWVRDGCGNMDGFPLYTRWLKVWYKAMKSENPDCVLGMGSIDYHSGVARGYEWIEGVYREGGRGYFDAISIHPYEKKETLHWRGIEDTRRVMVEHGDGDKGIWLTEYGWNTRNEEIKARKLTETFERLTRPEYHYVTAANYLTLTDLPNDDPYGLCDNEFKPRAGFHAFKRLSNRFGTGPTTRPGTEP